jgi:hypothetical protein
MEPVLENLFRSPGIDPQPGGIDSSESIPGLPKRLKIRAQESIPPVYIASRAGVPNRVVVPARQATQAGKINSEESITGLLKSLQIQDQEKTREQKE